MRTYTFSLPGKPVVTTTNTNTTNKQTFGVVRKTEPSNSLLCGASFPKDEILGLLIRLPQTPVPETGKS